MLLVGLGVGGSLIRRGGLGGVITILGSLVSENHGAGFTQPRPFRPQTFHLLARRRRAHSRDVIVAAAANHARFQSAAHLVIVFHNVLEIFGGELEFPFVRLASL